MKEEIDLNDIAKVFIIRYNEHKLFYLEVEIVKTFIENKGLSIFRFLNRLRDLDEELYNRFIEELNKESD